MAALRISMYLLRQIVHQLCSETPIKEIARNTKVSRNTIRNYRDRLQKLNKSKEEIQSLAEPELFQLFCTPRIIEDDRKAIFLSHLEHWREEFKRKHVTRRIIWEEYISKYPDGYSYSQFCFLLQENLKEPKVSMVGIHAPGEKFYTDFAGDKLSYIDREKGIEVKCDVLLLTLGYSNLTLAVALPNQKTESVAQGLPELFTRLGGVCSVLVPDNMKTAVIKYDPYEPVLNETFLSMANHYHINVDPARPRRPQDKAKVEVAVNIMYRKVYARIRNRQFYSLAELNETLKHEMDKLNDETMKTYGLSRRELFEQSEREKLKPLPERPFELIKRYYLKVQSNGHVQISSLKKYFSAPYQYTGKQVMVLLTPGLAQIYYDNVCIATHAYAPNSPVRYHTQRDHMPSNHQHYLDAMNPEKLITRAEQISPEVANVIRGILQKSIIPEQSYKTCDGILRLVKEFGRDVLIKSCIKALEYDVLSYKKIRAFSTISAHHDVYDTKPTGSLPQHQNIRGNHDYQ